jgi:hypothetical protein
MVDIDAALKVEIEVKDYEQVVKNDKGRFVGLATKVPGVNSLIQSKVDQTIVEEVKKNLEQTLPQKLANELTKGLQEEGVQASVSVSLTYYSGLQ